MLPLEKELLEDLWGYIAILLLPIKSKMAAASVVPPFLCINPRPPKVVVATPPPPVIFPRQLFWATEGCQTAICNLC